MTMEKTSSDHLFGDQSMLIKCSAELTDIMELTRVHKPFGKVVGEPSARPEPHGLPDWAIRHLLLVRTANPF